VLWLYEPADLSPFKMITPCGIADKPVGSVQTALGIVPDSSSSSGSSSGSGSVPQLQLNSAVQDPLITEYRYALLEALEEVLGLQLQQASQEQVQQLMSQNGTDSSSSSSSSRLGTSGAEVC
jgi:hypothetical protein